MRMIDIGLLNSTTLSRPAAPAPASQSGGGFSLTLAADGSGDTAVAAVAEDTGGSDTPRQDIAANGNGLPDDSDDFDTETGTGADVETDDSPIDPALLGLLQIAALAVPAPVTTPAAPKAEAITAATATATPTRPAPTVSTEGTLAGNTQTIAVDQGSVDTAPAVTTADGQPSSAPTLRVEATRVPAGEPQPISSGTLTASHPTKAPRTIDGTTADTAAVVTATASPAIDARTAALTAISIDQTIAPEIAVQLADPAGAAASAGSTAAVLTALKPAAEQPGAAVPTTAGPISAASASPTPLQAGAIPAPVAEAVVQRVIAKALDDAPDQDIQDVADAKPSLSTRAEVRTANPPVTLPLVAAGRSDQAPAVGLVLPAGRAFAEAIAASAVDQPTTRRRIGGDIAAATPAFDTLGIAAHASHATAPVAVSETAVDTRHAQWIEGVIDHIEVLRDAADATDTRIRLSPDALGKVDVAISREGDRVNVHFTTTTPEARQLLVDAQPRLAAIAETRGLKLGQSSVDSGSAGGNQTPQQQQQTATARTPAVNRTPLSSGTMATDGDDAAATSGWIA